MYVYKACDHHGISQEQIRGYGSVKYDYLIIIDIALLINIYSFVDQFNDKIHENWYSAITTDTTVTMLNVLWISEKIKIL